MKQIGILVKAHEEAIEMAREMETWLKAKGIEVLTRQNVPAPITSRKGLVENIPKAPSGLSCVVVLGGDGTFLSAIRWIQDTGIPILGVNLGNFGFLTETSADRIFPIMEDIINDAFTTEERILLSAQVFRDGEGIATQTVLNDVVINKEALARIAHIHTYIDDEYLTTFKADGLIVATPTGSTAYSLSAGGPIIYPSLETIILTPICPFTLTNRSLILPDTSTIKIRLDERDSNVFLTFDGQVGLHITYQDSIVIRKAPHTIHMIRTPDLNYYEVLKAKLKWGER
ncbi:MAG: NAD(+) kinase [Desulfobacterales bacterium C00003060]|nr:MAG: NAD(+) kinase [Desulfobacterales bacterium S3730MH5]OEU80945.1 MAG: NAD(+) kinase [Desulfobacterales bacterium S5133MH4]OEU81787.1 MAG: NAD(+) kinase [Desulfobacterales bacterium C00003060]